MRSSKLPAVATWLLEHLRSGSDGDYIAGDLIEAYECGRSRAWYWKEVLAAIIVSFYQEIIAHPVLALRALAIGWATWFLFLDGLAPKLVAPVFRRFFLPSAYPLSPWSLTWRLLSLFVFAASGWIVSRFHRPHCTAMVLLFTTSLFVSALVGLLPWVWFHAAETLTNTTRFLPYLLGDLESIFLPPTAVMLGGLGAAAKPSRPTIAKVAVIP